MCLGIPGQVIRVLDGYEGQVALVEVSGDQRKVNIGMLPGRPSRPVTGCSSTWASWWRRPPRPVPPRRSPAWNC